MPLTSRIQAEIRSILSFLLREGLAIDPSDPVHLHRGRTHEISFRGANYLSTVLKSSSYPDIYRALTDKGAYNYKMIDAALIQISYEFKGRELQRHRLAFMPSPDHVPFHDDASGYTGSIQDDREPPFLAENSSPPYSVPLRFDFDRPAQEPVLHPCSHLSLGTSNRCRIPVTRPLTPHRFVYFILWNFYGHEYANRLPRRQCGAMAKTILPDEAKLVHVTV